MRSHKLQFSLVFLRACGDLGDCHVFIKVVSPYHQKSKFQLQHCKVLPGSCHCCIGISRSSRSMKKKGLTML